MPALERKLKYHNIVPYDLELENRTRVLNIS